MTEMFLFRWRNPQNGNSDLDSYRAVSNSNAGSCLSAKGSPAKHLFGLNRASVESSPSNPIKPEALKREKHPVTQIFLFRFLVLRDFEIKHVR